MQKEIMLRGERVEYTLERKRVKNINLRIRPDGSIYVSAARGVPQPAIDRLILSNADYILEHRRRAGERMEKLRDCAEALYKASSEAIMALKLRIKTVDADIQRTWVSGGTGEGGVR